METKELLFILVSGILLGYLVGFGLGMYFYWRSISEWKKRKDV